MHKGIYILVLVLMVVPYAQAIGFQVPVDFRRGLDIDVGEEITYSIIVINDAEAKEVKFFVRPEAGVLVEGETFFEETIFMESRQKNSFSFSLEGVREGDYEVEYGISHGGEGSGAVSFEQVSSDIVFVDVSGIRTNDQDFVSDDSNSNNGVTILPNKNAFSDDEKILEGDSSVNGEASQSSIRFDVSNTAASQSPASTGTVNSSEGSSQVPVSIYYTMIFSVVTVIAGSSVIVYGGKNDLL